MFGFNKEEMQILRRLDTPQKIQNFLETIPINFEPDGDTLMSPRVTLHKRRAHCIEGALLAASAFMIHGCKPLLMDLKSVERDFDHVVALFRVDGYWGAVSKTNHAVLRYREPIYRSPRELAMSYFHEYFLDDGKKTMRSFSRPFNLTPLLGLGWTTSEENIWYIAEMLDDAPHENILTRPMIRRLRRADAIEIDAGKLVQYRRLGNNKKI